MTPYEIIKKTLESDTKLRERSLSREWLMERALEDGGIFQKWLDKQPLSMSDLLTNYKKYDNWRHAYSDVQKDHENLRGTDYNEKIRLEQEAMIEKGYEPNYVSDSKLLAKKLSEKEMYDLFEPKNYPQIYKTNNNK